MVKIAKKNGGGGKVKMGKENSKRVKKKSKG